MQVNCKFSYSWGRQWLTSVRTNFWVTVAWCMAAWERITTCHKGNDDLQHHRWWTASRVRRTREY